MQHCILLRIPVTSNTTSHQVYINHNLPSRSNSLVSEISNSGLGLTSLSCRAWLNSWVWLHWLTKKLLWQVFNTLQIKGVEEFEGEHNLVQLHLPIHPLKYPRSTSHSQTRVFVGQIWSLHRYVTVVPEVKAVCGLVPVTFLLWFVLN